MDARDFKKDTRTEDSGGDIDEFIAILERMKALKKGRRDGVSRDRSEEGQRKIMGGWMPSFEWEDFCDADRDRDRDRDQSKSISDGGVKMQEETGGGGEIQGSNAHPKKRGRDDVESAGNCCLGKRRSPQSKADILDLTSDDPEESKLTFTVGLPAFS